MKEKINKIKNYMDNGVDKLLNIEEVASILKDDIKKIDGNKTAQLFRNSLNPIKFIKKFT